MLLGVVLYKAEYHLPKRTTDHLFSAALEIKEC